MRDRKAEGQKFLLNDSVGAPTRNRILKSLESPKSCQQIARSLKLQWKTVKHHLDLMQEFGVIRPIKIGKRRIYQRVLD